MLKHLSKKLEGCYRMCENLHFVKKQVCVTKTAFLHAELIKDATPDIKTVFSAVTDTG